MQERLFRFLVAALLATAMLPAVAPNPGGAAGLTAVDVREENPTPTPTPERSNCQSGVSCGG